jgi:hypothetical protein
MRVHEREKKCKTNGAVNCSNPRRRTSAKLQASNLRDEDEERRAERNRKGRETEKCYVRFRDTHVRSGGRHRHQLARRRRMRIKTWRSIATNKASMVANDNQNKKADKSANCTTRWELKLRPKLRAHLSLARSLSLCVRHLAGRAQRNAKVAVEPATADGSAASHKASRTTSLEASFAARYLATGYNEHCMNSKQERTTDQQNR